MEIPISRDKHLPLAMYVTPDRLNITFAIPPPSHGRVWWREELHVWKKDRMDLTLKTKHRIVNPKTVIPEGDVPIHHWQNNIQVSEMQCCKAVLKIREVADMLAVLLIL
jgi:hypothetical protein